MSLHHIREVRRRGGKPALVTVIIGRKPAWLDDGPTLVHIGPKTGRQDWTPMHGVWATVFLTDAAKDRAVSVVADMEVAGVKLFGAASPDGVYALTQEPTTRERDLIRKEWEALCTA